MNFLLNKIDEKTAKDQWTSSAFFIVSIFDTISRPTVWDLRQIFWFKLQTTDLLKIAIAAKLT